MYNLQFLSTLKCGISDERWFNGTFMNLNISIKPTLKNIEKLYCKYLKSCIWLHCVCAGVGSDFNLTSR